MINLKLAQARGLGQDTIGKIERHQREAQDLVTAMQKVVDSEPDNYDKLLQLKHDWTEVQFKLQDLWGFAQNADFHRSYTLPGCKCPVMDNDDRLGTPYHVYAQDCQLHTIKEIK